MLKTALIMVKVETSSHSVVGILAANTFPEAENESAQAGLFQEVECKQSMMALLLSDASLFLSHSLQISVTSFLPAEISVPPGWPHLPNTNNSPCISHLLTSLHS